jgi:hypothetical protein
VNEITSAAATPDNTREPTADNSLSLVVISKRSLNKTERMSCMKKEREIRFMLCGDCWFVDAFPGSSSELRYDVRCS